MDGCMHSNPTKTAMEKYEMLEGVSFHRPKRLLDTNQFLIIPYRRHSWSMLLI
jgi:hypothetical protein